MKHTHAIQYSIEDAQQRQYVCACGARRISYLTATGQWITSLWRIVVPRRLRIKEPLV